MKDDAANEYIEKILGAEGRVLGSPVQYQDVTSEMKALIDRVGFVAGANGRMYRHKVGAAVTCTALEARMLSTMNHLFLSMEMIIAGRALGVGNDKGDVEKDAEGMEAAAALGKRTARAGRQ